MIFIRFKCNILRKTRKYVRKGDQAHVAKGGDPGLDPYLEMFQLFANQSDSILMCHEKIYSFT